MGTDLYIQPGLVPNFNHLNPSPKAPRLIGLSGYAGSGKDTVASIIHDLYGHEPRAFASRVKEFALAIDPMVEYAENTTGHGLDYYCDRLSVIVADRGLDAAKSITEVRRLFQEIGTRAREYFGRDVWVDAAFKDLYLRDRVVFSDVRFKNEALAVVEAGGVVLRVTRPEVEAVNNHISECDLDDWEFDGYIHNDGSLLDLQGTVMIALGDL